MGFSMKYLSLLVGVTLEISGGFYHSLKVRLLNWRRDMRKNPENLGFQNRLIPSHLYPNHEFIISVMPIRRRDDWVNISCGFLSGLWSDVGLDQGLLQEFRREVELQSVNHDGIIQEIQDFIVALKDKEALQSVRISTGKYMDSEGKPRYDDVIDVDFEGMFTDKDKETLNQLIRFLLKGNKKLKEIQWKLNTDPTRLADSTPQPALTDSRNNTSIKSLKILALELPDVEM